MIFNKTERPTDFEIKMGMDEVQQALRRWIVSSSDHVVPASARFSWRTDYIDGSDGVRIYWDDGDY